MKRLFVLLILSTTSTVANATNLHLVCGGEGSATRSRSTNLYASDSSGRSAYGSAVTTYDRQFEDQVNVEIADGQGRIRLPRTMLPIIHGGQDGWMRLTDIRETPNEITAHAAVNVMNNPNIRIDRITGSISISGRAGQYSGQCEPYDPETVQRRF